MRPLHPLAASVAVAALVLHVATEARAAAVPEVYSVIEGRDADDGRPVLVFVGKRLHRFVEFRASAADGSVDHPAPIPLLAGKDTLVLALDAAIPPGVVHVTLVHRGGELVFAVALRNGALVPGTVAAEALSEPLRAALDDAETLGGRPPAYYTDASNVDAGALATERFSAWDDLVAESRIGTGAAQAARGDHLHDARYATRTELGAPGTLNDGANPVEWTRLRGVPADFADGVDRDTTYTAGAGLTLSDTTFAVAFAGNGAAALAARSDHHHDGIYAALAHLHDDRYFTEAELSAAGGTLNAPANPLDWSRLKGVPEGFADGVDADTTYAAGAGLGLSGGAFSVLFAGGGSAATAARSDHDHDGTYAALAHLHDDRYFTEAELSAAGGTVNAPSNPVDWSRLKGVPADFADGVDADTTYAAGAGLDLSGGAFSVAFAGTGSATTAARSDHDHGSQYAAAAHHHDGIYAALAHAHDDRYFTESELSAAGGTLNASSNPVDWSRLKGVPAAFADGVDNDAWTTVGSDVARSAGRVGVGTTTPAASLHVAGNDGAFFGGTFGSGAAPPTGAGTKMYWYPAKGAFRAGRVTSSHWDASAVGNYSLASGRDATAREEASVALGISTLALSKASLAGGTLSTTEGDYAFAWGNGVDATGAQSVAMGFQTTSGGVASTALGYATEATGKGALAAGTTTLASGSDSVAFGAGTEATGSAAVAMGTSSTAQAYASLVLGRYNVVAGSKTSWTSTDPVLVVGNGTGDDDRANALTLLKDGNLTIAGTLTENSDERLKRDIEPLSGVLDRLEGVRAVTYRMRSGTPGGPQIGLLAQEVRAAFPELVAESAEGVLSVAYGKLAAVLVQAVREQGEAIRARDAAIEGLREELRAARAEAGVRLARVEAALGLAAGGGGR